METVTPKKPNYHEHGTFLYLTADLLKKLRQEAHERGCSKSWLARKAIAAYFNMEEESG